MKILFIFLFSKNSIRNISKLVKGEKFVKKKKFQKTNSCTEKLIARNIFIKHYKTFCKKSGFPWFSIEFSSSPWLCKKVRLRKKTWQTKPFCRIQCFQLLKTFVNFHYICVWKTELILTVRILQNEYLMPFTNWS